MGESHITFMILENDYQTFLKLINKIIYWFLSLHPSVLRPPFLKHDHLKIMPSLLYVTGALLFYLKSQLLKPTLVPRVCLLPPCATQLLTLINLLIHTITFLRKIMLLQIGKNIFTWNYNKISISNVARNICYHRSSYLRSRAIDLGVSQIDSLP